MDKSNIYYSPASLADLDSIFDFIVFDLDNQMLASTTIQNILETLSKLKLFPRMGPSLSSITIYENNYRYLLCGYYMIFYHIDKNDVYIDRVIHEKRDYISILFENELYDSE